MNKKLKQILILVILVSVLVLPYFVFAAGSGMLDKLKNIAGSGGYETGINDETKLASILGTVVSGFLSLLGIIFIILIIYAGQKWMTASGSEEKVTAAKETLWRSVIGLVIIVGAYAIWIFVSSKLFNTTG